MGWRGVVVLLVVVSRREDVKLRQSGSKANNLVGYGVRSRDDGKEKVTLGQFTTAVAKKTLASRCRWWAKVANGKSNLPKQTNDGRQAAKRCNTYTTFLPVDPRPGKCQAPPTRDPRSLSIT